MYTMLLSVSCRVHLKDKYNRLLQNLLWFIHYNYWDKVNLWMLKCFSKNPFVKSFWKNHLKSVMVDMILYAEEKKISLWSGILLATNYCVWYETNGYFSNNVMLASRTKILPFQIWSPNDYVFDKIFVILCCNLFYPRQKKRHLVMDFLSILSLCL